MNYSLLVDVYEKLESTSKRLEKTYVLSKLLEKTVAEDMEQIILLLQGQLYHPWESEEIGVASRIVLKSISIASGIEQTKIETEWKKTGDLGLVAEKVIHKKKQMTLSQQDITVKKVFDNLRKMTEFEGEGTVDRKVKLISELLTSATPKEAKYVVRTVLGELRVGVGTGSIRDAIAWAELPKVVGIFFECSKCKNFVPVQEKCVNCGAAMKNKFSDEIEKFKKSKVLEAETLEDVQKKDLRKYEYVLAKDEKTARSIYNYFMELIQTAYDKTNDFSIVAKTIKQKGVEGLAELELTPGNPVKVMLALKVKDVQEGFETVGVPCQIEYKYDGFRMLIGKAHGKITIFTRRLENVTKQFPEVVEYVKEYVKGDSFIIDSEAVGFDPKTGHYLPFQNVSQRIKRKYDIEKTAKELPVELDVFDILFYNGKNMINEPFKERRKLIEKIVKNSKNKIRIAEGKIVHTEKEAEQFYKKSLNAGNEGVMLKNLDSPYKPGARVGHMVKLKPTMETLDLVIVAAEWGEGKRATWLTSFTLACIDEDDNLLEIGKVGTGIKEKEDGEEGDTTFQMLTDLLKPSVTSEKGKHVAVKPKIVVEIKFEEIQKSPTYKSGFALRFPRLVRIRSDRNVDEINTLEDVKRFYKGQ